MTRELLRRIAANSAQSIRELAEGLSAGGTPVDRGLVEIAVRELERKGFLRRESTEVCAPSDQKSRVPGPAACSGCRLACAGREVVSWMLTDKAWRAVGSDGPLKDEDRSAEAPDRG